MTDKEIVKQLQEELNIAREDYDKAFKRVCALKTAIYRIQDDIALEKARTKSSSK